MKANTQRRNFSFSPIGIGSFGIGGLAIRDMQNDDAKQISAMIYALNRGINFVQLSMWAAEGYSAYLFSQAYTQAGIARDKIFIDFSAYHYNVASLKELDSLFIKLLGMLGCDYIDCFTLTKRTLAIFGKGEVIKYVKSLLDEGKIHYVGFTNGNVVDLNDMHQSFGDRLFWNEVCVNFEIRVNEELGITEFANQYDILNIIYQPLRRNRTANRNWPLLVKLAGKYHKTQNQIILNWLHSKGYLPIVKAQNIEHIDENLAAFDFKIESEDLVALNNFRPIPWITPKIDWECEGDGTLDSKGFYVANLANIFDDTYNQLI